MDTIREQILAAFAARMGATRSLRGGELALFDHDPETPTDPRISYNLIEAIIPARLEWQYQLTEQELDTASTIVNNKIGELLKTATESDRQLGGLCLDIVEQDVSWELRDAGSRIIGARIIFGIRYAYNRGDPFSNSNLS